MPTLNPFHQLRRNGQPADVAWVIPFLVSNQSSGITGTVLPIDSRITERHEQGHGSVDG
ncbi:SDR family oxidoreductase [Pseudomonas sp. IT-P258]|uniref:SDR family oxidoreductase n=1 Tax=Pseudomonas sp. IT-P258 TaxID=3026447 RepID=UPI0039E0189D